MKALPLLLSVSIVANAALVATVVFRPESRGSSDLGAAAGEAPASRATPAAGRPAGAVPVTQELVAALNHGHTSPEALREVLVAAGFDDELVRLLVGRRIRQKYAAERDAIRAAAEDEWWKDEGDYYSPERRERRMRQKQLNAEVAAEIERVLGPSAPSEPSSWEKRRYGNLAPVKLREIRLIEEDYRELIGEINAQARDFRLPEDSEKIRFLQEEKLADLAAVLTPAELESYQLRNSNTASQLRSAMTRMNATEAEFRLLHDLRRQFDEAYNTNAYTGGDSDPGPEFWKARSEAEKQLELQLRDALGAERYLEYKRSQDYGYRQLQGAAERFGLPPETPARTYAIRQEIPAAAMAVAKDDRLKPAEKQEALAKLAAQARDRVAALYGADLAGQVLKTQGMRWIDQLERGQVSLYDEAGRQTEGRHVSFQ